MKGKTRNISVTALMIALTVVLLYIASVIPSGRIATVAVAGLITAAAVIECGIPSGCACFVCSALLAFVLLPQKSAAILYAIFLGYYPILKSVFEHLKNRYVEWALKIVLCNAALAAAYLLWRYGFLPDIAIETWQTALIFVLGSICFVVYDIGFSRLAYYYTTRIHKKR